MSSRHYFLIVATVVFLDDEGQVANATLNAILENPARNLTVSSIGRAQQTAQMIFFKRLDGPPPKVLDVIIRNCTHLGEMTPEEFHDKPTIVDISEVN